MPVVAIDPNKRMTLPYTFPKSGKVRITIEASTHVDIFVALQEQESMLGSILTAKAANIFCLERRVNETQLLTFPEAWRNKTWVLAIANPNPFAAGVVYNVFEA